MRTKIKQTILKILSDKRANGDVLPFATSLEVAHLLNASIRDVEKLSERIDGIVSGKMENGEWYYYE